MEVYAQHHDLEQVRGLLGHTRLETTQTYAQIQPRQLKQAVNFYEANALDAELSDEDDVFDARSEGRPFLTCVQRTELPTACRRRRGQKEAIT